VAVRNRTASRSRIGVAIIIAVLAIGAEAAAQQVASIYLGAPIYETPNVYTEPILVAGPDSTAHILTREGVWYRISFDDSQGQKRVGYVQASYVRISQLQRVEPKVTGSSPQGAAQAPVVAGAPSTTKPTGSETPSPTNALLP
jgi:hypothetical protein